MFPNPEDLVRKQEYSKFCSPAHKLPHRVAGISAYVIRQVYIICFADQAVLRCKQMFIFSSVAQHRAMSLVILSDWDTFRGCDTQLEMLFLNVYLNVQQG